MQDGNYRVAIGMYWFERCTAVHSGEDRGQSLLHGRDRAGTAWV